MSCISINISDNFEKIPCGFPELFSASQKEAQRWRLAYGSRLVQEDIRDLELIREIDKKELLYDRLLLTVSSVLSIKSLREDLQVNHFSAKASLIVILLEPCLILTVQK